MTIAAAYLTSEGVVLGADSTTTVNVQPQGQVVQLLNHAQKVFEVGAPGKGRIGICAWGGGKIGDVSHRTLCARLSDVSEELSVADATTEFQKIVDQVGVKQQGVVGYYVGGWDKGNREPRCFRIYLENGRWVDPYSLKIGEASFSGNSEYFSRIFHGFDGRLPKVLHDELCKKISGLPVDFSVKYQEAFNIVAQGLASVGFNDLPIREAIDFIHMHLLVTIKAAKFRYGPPTVGGPIEIGFITTDRFFRWACHKRHSSAIFEQETAYDE
jgi:hypothetical protein